MGMRFSPKQREALELVANGRFLPTFVKESDGWHARWRALGHEENDWVDEYVRAFAMTRLSEDAEDQKHETLHDAWILALRSRTGLVRWDEEECIAFAEELKEWSGSADEDVASRKSIVFALEAAGDGFKVKCGIPGTKRGLKSLGQAAYVWGVLRGLRRSGDGLEVVLSHDEAEDFIRHGAGNLRDAGYGLEGVDISAPVTAEAEIGETADKLVKLTVRVDGEEVGIDELRFLLDQGSTLVFFRNRWIEVDRGILKEALRALEKGVGKKTNLLGFAMGLGHIGNLEIENVKAYGWLRGLVEELRAKREEEGARREEEIAKRVAGFEGELRDYQKRGVDWMGFLTGHGFGALLADDMGLGKTVQAIAWMLSARPASVLVVAPLTLLANWRHELARFAPSLKVYVHQGDNRHLASGFRKAVGKATVTITSYNLLVKDYAEISEIGWDALVLDEAQAIKNPDTRIAQAVRALTPKFRIAMTGTPIENTVGDLWSIEEFLNPGFLGERKMFHDRFARAIAEDPHGTAGRRLRHALEPFILRRLKTDGAIAAELGDKREIREYCELGAAERREYEDALEGFRNRERSQGEVFALITRLKLICDGAGKLERLCELLETIFAAGESALVFTQYAKVGAWLKKELDKRFGKEFPFLHGELSVAAREKEIAKFNRRGPNAFILSLKAGGFGLNLTKATHVIHFDRWWNPAVENQATDRAHRIGQVNTVFVHLFITSGTLEEHVDEILQRKESLKTLLAGGEGFWEAVRLEDRR